MNHNGESSIFDDEIVRNVMHLPDFKFNLLSVSKITLELSCFVSFYDILLGFPRPLQWQGEWDR